MSVEATVGRLKETFSELIYEWDIDNIQILIRDVDKSYRSPVFYFADTLWYILMFPHGEIKSEPAGYIGIYLMRTDSGPATKSVWYKFSIKTADGKQLETGQEKASFGRKRGRGVKKALLRSSLLDQKPGPGLRVVCYLTYKDVHNIEDSYFTRLLHLSNDMKAQLAESRRSDFILKVDDREFAAHRMILEMRSEYFARMLQQDMKESRTGVMTVKDMHPDAVEAMLSYIYTADVHGVTYDNVFLIYSAAHRYDLKELKTLCNTFLEENLCDEHVCDVINLTSFYSDKKLFQIARAYFYKNAERILKTDTFKQFSKENQELAMDLLTNTIHQRL